MSSKYLGSALMSIGQELTSSIRTNRTLAQQEEERKRKRLIEDRQLGRDDTEWNQKQEELRQKLADEAEARGQLDTFNTDVSENDQFARELAAEKERDAMTTGKYTGRNLGESSSGSPVTIGPTTAGRTLGTVNSDNTFSAPSKFELGQSTGLDRAAQVLPQAKGAWETITNSQKNNNDLKFKAQMEKDTPETKSKALELLDSFQAGGQYPNVNWDAWKNRITDSYDGAYQFNKIFTAGQTGTDEAVRKTTLMTPAKTEQAASVAGASTESRIKSEYDTKADIPGSLNQNQYTAGNYANRIEQAEAELSGLSQKGFDPGSLYNMVKSADALNAIKDPDQRKYAQAMRNFINATMRRESGAAIAQSEFSNANKQYFAQLNDDPETAKQKKENRLRVFDAFRAEAGGAYGQINKPSQERKVSKFKILSAE